MKKTIILLSGLLLSFSIISCQNDKSTKSEDMKLDEGTFKEFATSVKFEQDYTLDITNTDRDLRKVILDEVDRLEDEFDDDKNLEGVSYQIVHQGDKIRFYDFQFDSKGNSSIKEMINSETCSEGFDFVTKCDSDECLDKTLSDLSSSFSEGEVISVAQVGEMRKVCSNVK